MHILTGLRGRAGKKASGQLVGLAIAAGWALASCTLLAETDPNAGLPPCVDDACNCGDFRDQAQAQQVLEAFWGDPHQLDRDGNGAACERLLALAPPLEAETYFSNSAHVALGNPSRAAKVNPANYLIEKEQYVLGYSRDRNTLLWASWWLGPDWLGASRRQDDFRPDGSLPAGFYQATPNDYTGSGYDRGHMVPSADRKLSDRDNSATFLMTNVFPQTRENNRGPWRELEEYCRDLVYQQGKSLYVIGGIYGQRETLPNGITVPSRIWKVIVVFDRLDPAVADITPRTATIAVDMPNSRQLDDRWQTYLTSIDRIELATGYDLLSAVPESVQAELEARH
ncbi:MAG: DNA/RNA non-specific endonuclease [Leptolyngbya sp. SIO4C1]|nr:DNA/RNA non-specific endonuclease [Leptolyngbya sp. SIO4C1]